MEAKIKRIHLLDEIRGLSIILMVFYHSFFMLGYFFDIEFLRKTQVFFEPLQPLFACLFILISGISSNLSRSNFKRGIKLFGIAVGFTVVTAVVLPKLGITGAQIIFVILHLLSVSMLLYALFYKLLEKIPMSAGIIIFFLLYVFTCDLQDGSFFSLSLPQSLFADNFTAALGFPPVGFYSADYFPLIPFVFVFFCGTFLGRLAKENKFPEFFYRSHCKPLSAVGKRTLIIYIAHWPIIFLLGLIISLF